MRYPSGLVEGTSAEGTMLSEEGSHKEVSQTGGGSSDSRHGHVSQRK